MLPGVEKRILARREIAFFRIEAVRDEMGIESQAVEYVSNNWFRHGDNCVGSPEQPRLDHAIGTAVCTKWPRRMRGLEGPTVAELSDPRDAVAA